MNYLLKTLLNYFTQTWIWLGDKQFIDVRHIQKSELFIELIFTRWCLLVKWKPVSSNFLTLHGILFSDLNTVNFISLDFHFFTKISRIVSRFICDDQLIVCFLYPTIYYFLQQILEIFCHYTSFQLQSVHMERQEAKFDIFSLFMMTLISWPESGSLFEFLTQILVLDYSALVTW